MFKSAKVGGSPASSAPNNREPTRFEASRQSPLVSIDAEAPNAKESGQIHEVLIGRVRAGRGAPRGAGVVGKDSERAPLVFRNATDDFRPVAAIVEGSASLFEPIDRSRGILRNGKYRGHSDGSGEPRALVRQQGTVQAV